MDRIVFVICLLAFPIISISQNAENAIVKYAENGKLISVANLSSLKECSIRTATGKVISVKLAGNLGQLRLQNKKEVPVDFEVPLERLLDDDRRALFSDLLKRKMPLRVAGYACNQGSPLSALNIYRVY